MSPSTTLAQRVGQGRISQHMCRAIRALRADGWTVREVAFALELNETTVTRHDNGQCSCPNGSEGEDR